MEDFRIRKPAVAGQFYPLSADKLKKQLEQFIPKETIPREVIACILPHAGYIYSGKVAGETIAQVKIRESVVLIGPNHTGYGSLFSIMSEGIWQTPLGEVEIDTLLAKSFLKKSKELKDDVLAHFYEHCLEVELPFLQYIKNDFKIVPLVLMGEDFSVYENIGTKMSEAVLDLKMESSVLMVASSDMTHYEPQESAQKKDNLAIEAILKLDEKELLRRVRKYNISMCGWPAVATMLVYAKRLGAHNAKLIQYQTSGDITGDYSSVVGYAGIIIY